MSNDASPAAIWCFSLRSKWCCSRWSQWCDVCHKMWRSHASLGEAVIIGEANIICRRQTSFKKRTFVLVDKSAFFVGGEGGIWTLDTLLGYTRFPIVRARPATRLLHKRCSIAVSLCIIPHLFWFVNPLFHISASNMHEILVDITCGCGYNIFGKVC